MTLLLRAGEWQGVTPRSAGWRFLSFHVERLAGADTRHTAGEETAIVLLEGRCTAEVDGTRFELGPRAGVFEASRTDPRPPSSKPGSRSSGTDVRSGP